MSCHEIGLDPSSWSDVERRHAAGCPSCRQRLVAADPLTAFALLPARPSSAEEVALMQERVRASLRAHRVEARTGAVGRRRAVAARAAGVAIVLGGSLGLLALDPDATRPPESGFAATELPREYGGDEAALLRDLSELPVLVRRDGATVRGDEMAAVLVVGTLDV